MSQPNSHGGVIFPRRANRNPHSITKTPTISITPTISMTISLGNPTCISNGRSTTNTISDMPGVTIRLSKTPSSMLSNTISNSPGVLATKYPPN